MVSQIWNFKEVIFIKSSSYLLLKKWGLYKKKKKKYFYVNICGCVEWNTSTELFLMGTFNLVYQYLVYVIFFQKDGTATLRFHCVLAWVPWQTGDMAAFHTATNQCCCSSVSTQVKESFPHPQVCCVYGASPDCYRPT